MIAKLQYDKYVVMNCYAPKEVACAKKSISDWMNRMNGMIRRKAKEEAFLSRQRGKTISVKPGSKKGSGADKPYNC